MTVRQGWPGYHSHKHSDGVQGWRVLVEFRVLHREPAAITVEHNPAKNDAFFCRDLLYHAGSPLAGMTQHDPALAFEGTKEVGTDRFATWIAAPFNVSPDPSFFRIHDTKRVNRQHPDLGAVMADPTKAETEQLFKILKAQKGNKVRGGECTERC